MKQILSFEDDRIVYIAGNKTKKSIAVKKAEMEPFSSDDYEGKKAALSFLVERCRLKNKKIDVVLPSRGLLLRELYVPSLRSKKQQRETLSNEMLYYHSNLNEFAVDYFPNGHIDEDGLKGFIACAISKAMFDEYLTLLREVGVKANTIDVAPDCVAQFITMFEYANQPVVFVEINNSHTELYLFDQGCAVLVRRLNFRYASFSGNTQILAEELADHIHKLLQFQSTRRVHTAVKEVLISGDVPELVQLAKLIQSELDVIRPAELQCTVLPIGETVKVPNDTDANLCLKAIGATLKCEMNFLKTTSLQEEHKGYALPVLEHKALVFLCFYAVALVVIPFGVGKVHEHILASRTAEVMAAMADTEEATEYERLSQVQQEYLDLKRKNDELDAKRQAIEALIQVDADTYHALTSLMKPGTWIRDAAFSAYSGVLTVTFRAQEEGESTTLVEELRKQDYFASVGYTGWMLSDEQLKFVQQNPGMMYQTQPYMITSPSSMNYSTAAPFGAEVQKEDTGEYEFALVFVMKGAVADEPVNAE